MLILFATSPDLPALTEDDIVAADALAARDIRVEPLVWGTQPAERPDAVVIRSCWDYHLREQEFRTWIAGLEDTGVPLINPAALVRWNLHKSYIGDLERRGVATVPTAFVAAGDTLSLSEIVAAQGWRDAVVKPAVSLSAYETWRVTGDDADTHEQRFAQLRARGDVLVQRFLPEITAEGEWSLVFFGTRFSHAVRKLPKAGDFRVQIEHGGSVLSALPPQRIIDAADRVLAAVPEPPVYCRIDGVVADDVFMVMEVECIDPVLFFAAHSPAASYFTDALTRYLDGAAP